MTEVPKRRSETAFDDYKPAYTHDQAVAEANRCLHCHDAPCITACPTGIDIPSFIRKIATGNVKGSARTIFDSNILGMSCARVCPVEVLCVGACVYNEMGIPAIQIGRLQRHSTDAAYANGWRFFEAGPDTGFSVALVGAGPASLAAAHELRRLGHGVTLYEKHSYLGGLNTNGVAPYKMRADAAMAEVDWVLGIGGVAMRTGVEVGRDVSWSDLEAKHDAVFVGLGLGPDRFLGAPGESLPGVRGAVDFIEQIKLGEVDLSGVKRAAVIGGGNTAIDCVRELLGLGVPEVYMVYRGDEAGMSGYAHEWHAGRVASARALWHTLPVAYEGDGRLQRIRLAKLGADKRPTGEQYTMDFDLALLAIGQSRLGDLLKDVSGVRLEGGRLVVDAQGFTGRPGWFAGGDCANGGKEVVNAAAEGKAAARGIDAWLRGRPAKSQGVASHA